MKISENYAHPSQDPQALAPSIAKLATVLSTLAGITATGYRASRYDWQVNFDVDQTPEGLVTLDYIAQVLHDWRCTKLMLDTDVPILLKAVLSFALVDLDEEDAGDLANCLISGQRG